MKCRSSILYVVVIILCLVIIINVFTYIRITFPLMYNNNSSSNNEYLRDIYRIHLLNETLMALHQELQAVAVLPYKDIHAQETNDLKPNSAVQYPPNNVLRRDSVNMIAMEQPTVKHSRDDIHVDNRTMVPKRMKSAVLFTMDSIYSYEQNSLTGGASGELIVRKALEYAFDHFGARIDVLRSDRDFNRCKLKNYDIIILDTWTWASKGWVPKAHLKGHEEKVFILDFFGCKGLRGKSGFQIDQRKFLTAFGSKYNTFLGYYLPELPPVGSEGRKAKSSQGVIWGKDPRHLEDKVSLLKQVANQVNLFTTATEQLFKHKNVYWVGHQTPENWMKLLGESKFLLGLGNPISGPSAIDAISMGCMFINPVYNQPVVVNDIPVSSQHPFAEKIGLPYVCNYKENSAVDLQRCIKIALESNLQPYIPKEFTLSDYLQRVKSIFLL